jgi:RNA polymerase sigma factor (sigma-70 family)
VRLVQWVELPMSEPETDTPYLSGLRLDRISTHMTTLQDAERFVLRYGRAIRGYVAAILRDQSEAEEVVQELVLGLLRRGGASTWPGAGRFRDYLKASARNAAITFLRKKGRTGAGELIADAFPDPGSTDAAANRAMIAAWQACILDKVFRELDAHERRSPGNLCHTALKVYTEHPNEDSPQHAAIVSAKIGRHLTAEAFRKQVSRAKRLAAEFILLEVAAGIVPAAPESVEAELHELGLWHYVRDYLPHDWQSQFFGDRD